ncbi:MAG TPA: TIGR01777 family oxidoreductase [Solirubrobacteraceae bacterium]|nr:TIGR01777 family oxidoreductase [Solirubrobacteraceae bacterium]
MSSGGQALAAARVTLTGATGLIGRELVDALGAGGTEVTVLSRDPERARARLGGGAGPALEVLGWSPEEEPAPAAGLEGRDAVVSLAGEPIAQRWSAAARRAIHDSRVVGTRNLVAALRDCQKRPRTLVSASAVGYYGPHGDEPLDEEAPPGSDFLAGLCAEWEMQAAAAGTLGVRVVQLRTGVVLARRGGALAKMLLPFRLGLGGPVAGGRQYMSWIALEDHVAMILAALADERFGGPVNATAPEPVTNAEFSRALARALRRPALLPLPALALRTLYGEMAEIVTTGVRALPAKALMLGFEFRHTNVREALRAALAS